MSDGAVDLRGRKVTFGASWFTPRGDAADYPPATRSLRKLGLLQPSTSCPSLRLSVPLASPRVASPLPSPHLLVSSTSTSTSASSSPCPSAIGSTELSLPNSPSRGSQRIPARSVSQGNIRQSQQLNWDAELGASAPADTPQNGLNSHLTRPQHAKYLRSSASARVTRSEASELFASGSSVAVHSPRDATCKGKRSLWEELFQRYNGNDRALVQERADGNQAVLSSPRDNEASRLAYYSSLQRVPSLRVTTAETDDASGPFPKHGSGIVYEPKSRISRQESKSALVPPNARRNQRLSSSALDPLTGEGDVRTRSRSNSFQEEKSHKGQRKRPHSVQLQPSTSTQISSQLDSEQTKRSQTVQNPEQGRGTARSVLTGSSSDGEKGERKASGREIRRTLREQAKKKAQHEKEERKELKRKKKEEKRMMKDKRKKQSKEDKEKRHTATSHVTSPRSQRLVHIPTLFSSKPPHRRDSHFSSEQNGSETSVSTGVPSPLSAPASSTSTSVSVKPKPQKTRMVKIEDLDPRVWLFEVPDSDENIVLGGKDSEDVPLVNAASIYKIIQRITYSQYPDPNFVTAFLLTYRSFLTSHELLELLELRFDTPPPENTDASTFEKTTQVHIRLRVFNVLKQWLLQHFYDFRDEPKLLERLNLFIDDVMIPEAMVSAGEQLKHIIEKQLRNENGTHNRELQFNARPPPPFLPVNLKKLPIELLDLHPEEVARQLTLIEHNLYRSIKPSECLKQTWTSQDKATVAPNILALTERFNKVSRWCCTEIVNEKDIKRRAVILARFLMIASKCRDLNNFNGVMEILAGLQNSAVYRLKRTWNHLPSKAWDIWEELTHLMSTEDNFRVFREALHKINPPCIPYLGVFLTDLTFIEEGNPDHLPSSNLINVTKLRYVARVIQDIRQYQQTPYCLEAVPILQEWLQSMEVHSEKDLYSHSLMCEEREPRKK